jgi:pSer/pThr/pTyr-binding forkhead associated (FHA) protein
MKLSLIVLTPGKTQGKAIPISLSQFLIGRDPHCQLRPASPMISNRHCALLTRGGKVFVRDFESTNGTFVNQERVRGEKGLKHGDHLRLGPLEFRVELVGPLDVDQPTPLPSGKSEAPVGEDEAAAALLLELQDNAPNPAKSVDSEGIPTGSTVMEIPAATAQGDTPLNNEEAKKPEEDEKKKKAAEKAKVGDTAVVANELLQKYLRRPRKPTV